MNHPSVVDRPSRLLEGLNPEQLAAVTLPAEPALILAGARSGKDSRIACPIVVYEAIFGEWATSPGERPVIPLIAQNADAGRVAFEYVEAYLEMPRLRPMKLSRGPRGAGCGTARAAGSETWRPLPYSRSS